MKLQLSLFFVLIMLLGCYDKSKEKTLELKSTELAQKEQELTLRENALSLKAEELAQRERLLDSTANTNIADTLAAIHPTMVGVWNVTMRCTETTCIGSAVGDTKKEQWNISFKNNAMIAHAINDNQLVRIYSGPYIGDSFVLTAQQESNSPAQAAKIVVRLQKPKDNQLSGQREIIRPEECRILYSLDLQKQ